MAAQQESPAEEVAADLSVFQAPEVLVCPEKCRPEDNKNRTSLVYGRTIDAWGMVRPLQPAAVRDRLCMLGIQQRCVTCSLAHSCALGCLVSDASGTRLLWAVGLPVDCTPAENLLRRHRGAMRRACWPMS